jgi:hypothetical protein
MLGINTWAAGNFSARYVHEHLPMPFFCNVSGDRGIQLPSTNSRRWG